MYNGYNSLGHAYLEIKENLKAADAFKGANQYHPEDKAGYCDLAYAYLILGDQTLCTAYLKQTIKLDPTARDDIKADAPFAKVTL